MLQFIKDRGKRVFRYIFRKGRERVKAIFIKSENFIIRGASCFGVRPVIMLDGYQKQLDWFGIDQLSLLKEGLRARVLFMNYRIDRLPPPTDRCMEPPLFDESLSVDLTEIYRGVNLFSAIEYSLYVSLEVARHEYDSTNLAHRTEASRWMLHARYVTDELYLVFQTFNPRSVVIVQGYFVEAAIVRQLASKFAVQVFALENTFWSARMICEPFSGISVNKTTVMSWYYRSRDALPFSLTAKYAEDLVNHIDSCKCIDHAAPTRKFVWPEKRKRIVFLAQCLTDSSLLFGLSGGYSTVEIAESIIKYAEARDVFVFFKLHPKEKEGFTPLMHPYNQLTLRRLRDSGFDIGAPDNIQDGVKVVFDSENEYSTLGLISDADVVVTINSQGGLEAQALGKEVVLLGSSFYDGLGTTWSLPALSLLPAALDRILVDGEMLVDKKKLAEFFYIYFNLYCVSRNAKGLVAAIRERRLNPVVFRQCSDATYGDVTI